MTDKEGVYRLLDEKGIAYERYEHKPVYTVEEADTLDIPFTEFGIKNLFLKDKYGHYYMVCLKGEKLLDMKILRQEAGIKKPHFASEDELEAVTGLKRGHVTPFGVLNSTDGVLTVMFDAELKGSKVGVHPMSNDATVFLMLDDLCALLKEERPDADIRFIEL